MFIIRLPITSIVTVTARGIGEVKLDAGRLLGRQACGNHVTLRMADCLNVVGSFFESEPAVDDTVPHIQ